MENLEREITPPGRHFLTPGFCLLFFFSLKDQEVGDSINISEPRMNNLHGKVPWLQRNRSHSDAFIVLVWGLFFALPCTRLSC